MEHAGMEHTGMENMRKHGNRLYEATEMRKIVYHETSHCHALFLQFYVTTRPLPRYKHSDGSSFRNRVINSVKTHHRNALGRSTIRPQLPSGECKHGMQMPQEKVFLFL